MQRRGRRAILAAAFVILFAGGGIDPANGFGLSGLGIRGGVLDPEDLDAALTIGGHLEFEERGRRIHLQPNLFYWSSDNVSDLNPNFDVYYHFAPARSVSPYLGTGFGIHFMSFDLPRGMDDDETNAGLNLFGGVRFPGRSVDFFIEGRAALTEWDTTSITAGVTFPVGR
jgi:hypothetical protein